MTEGTTVSRSFSNEKHASGEWRTRMVVCANPLVRAVASFLSYKRAGVDRLARDLPSPSAAPLVVDLGAGQGAYTHWFLGRREATVIAVDWSFSALRRIPAPRRGTVLRLCADAQKLPLKPETADAMFTIDMLGHTENIGQALDEMLRVVKCGSPFFLHSECGSYQNRWPDAMLIKRIGYDLPARGDGHQSLLTQQELRALVSRRFSADKIWSPAGLTGWLTGYPEKYRPAFKEAGCGALQTLTALFALIKKTPVAGLALRLVNSCINHIETAIGITDGGGSFFARLRKPGQPSGPDSRKGLS